MKLVIIDGQNGRMGALLTERVKAAGLPLETLVVGTNAIATAAMMKAGADRGATGENPVLVACRDADIIAGPIGILMADALMGEITPAIAVAIGQSRAQKVLLTTSGTTALDMAMLLCDIQPGDEVILPSFTFSSTATSAVLAGAKLVFVDVRPDTMNIDEKKIEQAITDKTRVIIAMHYAGVACEMDTIMDIARRHDLKVVEDAAQGVMSSYKGKALGTIGDFGCYSFHETKNYSMGEGGALVINNPDYNERAEILREKGTNRAKFFRGQVDKYTWVDFGDSYLPSELNAAYLWAQLLHADEIKIGRASCRERV